MFEDQFIVVFLRTEDKLNRVVKSIRKKTPTIPMKFGNKSYIIDFKMPTYCFKNKRYYLVNLETGTQFTMEKNPPLLTPDELDLMMSNHVIADITNGILNDQKEKLMYIGIGALIGALIGYIISNTLMQQKIDTILNDQQITLKSLIEFSKGLLTLTKFWRV